MVLAGPASSLMARLVAAAVDRGVMQVLPFWADGGSAPGDGRFAPGGHVIAAHPSAVVSAGLAELGPGGLVPFLRDLGVWDASGLAPSWEWITWKASRAPVALFAHGNYLPPNTRLPPNATVVFCPRTHAAFGHPPHPFRELMGQGVRIALGTDSLASNPDLNVLAEARFIHEHYPDVPGDQLLRMATLNGAEALGFGRMTGSLEAGKSADLVVLSLPDRDPSEPIVLLLDVPVDFGRRQTMWRGNWRTDLTAAVRN